MSSRFLKLEIKSQSSPFFQVECACNTRDFAVTVYVNRFLNSVISFLQVECAFNTSDFTVTVTVNRFSKTGGNNVSVSLTITAARPVSTVEILTPLDNYTNEFTILDIYSIRDLQINRKYYIAF